MAEIIPAIIALDFAEIKRKIALVESVVNWVQIDIVDGLFAENYTWERFQDLADLPGKVKIEIHLMVEQPEHYVDDWLKVADRLLVHLESTDKLPNLLAKFANSPVKLGLAALLETPLEQIKEYAGRFDYLQLMGIKNIGVHGEKFEPATLDRVKFLRQEYPRTTLAVDGGIDLAIAKDLRRAGADNLVIGSALWQSPDPVAAIKEFQQL